MSRYYRLAILNSPDSLEDMKKAVRAKFYHMTSTDENPEHSYCSISWCQYLKLKAENKKSTFIHPATFIEKLLRF